MNSQELMHEYLNGVAALRQATDGMTADQSRARPVPGKWSTLEVVCHLADIEALDAERMKRVIAEDQPTLMDADETRYAAALAYQERELSEEVALIESTRRQMTRILRTLPPSALSRGSVYRIGDKTENRTLEQLLNKGRIKDAERVLGRQLVQTQVGGKDVQRSFLTPPARRLVTDFLAMRDAMIGAAKQQFSRRFRSKRAGGTG